MLGGIDCCLNVKDADELTNVVCVLDAPYILAPQHIIKLCVYFWPSRIICDVAWAVV